MEFNFNNYHLNVDAELVPILVTAVLLLLVRNSALCRQLILSAGTVVGLSVTVIAIVLIITTTLNPITDFVDDTGTVLASTLAMAIIASVVYKVWIGWFFGKSDGLSISEILLITGWSFLMDTYTLWYKGVTMHQNGRPTSQYLKAMGGFAFITLIVVGSTLIKYGSETARTRIANYKARRRQVQGDIEEDDDGMMIHNHLPPRWRMPITPAMGGVAISILLLGGWYFFSQTPNGRRIWDDTFVRVSAQPETRRTPRILTPAENPEVAKEREKRLRDFQQAIGGGSSPKPLPTAKPKQCDCVLPGGRMKSDGGGGSYLQVTCQNGWIGPASEAIGIPRC